MKVEKTQFKCLACDERHDDYFDAVSCCNPEEIYTVYWVCDNCESVHNNEEDYDDCECTEAALYLANQRRLEEAGQMRLFS